MGAELAWIGLLGGVESLYLILLWTGLLCVAFAVVTALLDWGPGWPAEREPRISRRLLVLIGVLGLAAFLVGAIGFLFAG